MIARPSQTSISADQTLRCPTVCEADMCCGCMACTAVCRKGAITFVDSLSSCNARIDMEKCVSCGRCHAVCPKNQQGGLREPVSWFQGWALPEAARAASSSGGFATAIARAFVRYGGIVCSCAFENSEFRFSFVETEDDLGKFRGSKYVRSNPGGCYEQIRKMLIEGHRVLFIGLPCQVMAVRNYVSPKHEENLFTVDLVCHGTPSPLLLDKYLTEHDAPLCNLTDISFRKKDAFRVAEGERSITVTGTTDAYSMAFLGLLTYAEGCYRCPFACGRRIGDITLGDSWGSLLGSEEAKKGISLALCQTEKGKDLLMSADVHLESVDVAVALENNEQLCHPSHAPRERELFFRKLASGASFDSCVFRCMPKRYLRQAVKGVLIRLGLYKVQGGGSLLPERGSKRD